MAWIFITGSSDGLGLLAGQWLVERGHRVVLHARNQGRAAQTLKALPHCAGVVIGDVSTLAGMREVAAQANSIGRFHAVIHNVGIGYQEPKRVETSDGLSRLFAINVAAPYVLTALLHRPDRLVYLSSGMHHSGSADLDDAQWRTRPWDGSQAYSDSKLHDLILALAMAQRWRHTLSNAVHPGWVPTRMGGAHAPDDLAKGALTQAWLSTTSDAAAQVTGQYFHHQQPVPFLRAAGRQDIQDGVLGYLKRVTGVAID